MLAESEKDPRAPLLLTLLVAFILLLPPLPATAGGLAPLRLFPEGKGENPFAQESVDSKKLERGLKVIGIGVAGGLFWIVSLRRRVAVRTRQLRSQLERVRQAEGEIARLHAELVRTRSEIAFTLGEVIESRSHETANHVRRVAAMTEFLVLAKGGSAEKAGLVGLASALHDVGKIAVPDAILNKPGRLTADEFGIVRTHTTMGHRILSACGGGPLFDLAASIALEHHEKWDGSGYPQGLSGEAICPEARLVAIADVFDALAGRRVYKAPWPLDRIVHELIAERGRHFEPAVVDLFLQNLEKILSICRAFPDGSVKDTGEEHLSPSEERTA